MYVVNENAYQYSEFGAVQRWKGCVVNLPYFELEGLEGSKVAIQMINMHAQIAATVNILTIKFGRSIQFKSFHLTHR